MKGQRYSDLDDEKWISDLAFGVDITSHQNDINLKLQGKNKLNPELQGNVNAFYEVILVAIAILSKKC